MSKPWMKQPGECLDKKGYPIYPGDLLKTPHFKSGHKQYYHYHVAVYADGCMRLYSPAMADPVCPRDRRLNCLMSQDLVRDSLILSGDGPGDFYSYEQRKRQPTPPTSTDPVRSETKHDLEG